MATKNTRSTVVGVFEDHHAADKAISDLMKAGFSKDQIGAAMRHNDRLKGVETKAESDETYAEEGAVAGALTGLGLGALAGLGVLAGAIPVVGPAITAGTLGVLLTNAAAGAGIAGLVGALVGAGVPEEEAKYYHEEFEAGRTIVTVKADGRADEATAILRRHGAYDMSTRGASARTGTARDAAHCDSDKIQVKEERLHAEKQPVEAGAVNVRKEVHTETKSMEVPVRHEEVVVERKPVHKKAGEACSTDIREGEEIRIPVAEEQVNVSKDAVVTEEVKVGKRVVEDTEQVAGRVRKEEVKVEEVGDVDVKTRGKGTKS